MEKKTMQFCLRLGKKKIKNRKKAENIVSFVRFRSIDL